MPCKRTGDGRGGSFGVDDHNAFEEDQAPDPRRPRKEKRESVAPAPAKKAASGLRRASPAPATVAAPFYAAAATAEDGANGVMPPNVARNPGFRPRLFVGPNSPPSDEQFMGNTYDAALRARKAAHQIDLENDTNGQAIFALLDCDVDRTGQYTGLLV